MITGFNPADMYAADHIRRVLKTFPGVFTGIGEFTIHKEFVSPKVAGETASLTNPALDRILDFAAEVGLVVLLHNDIDMPFPQARAGAGLPDADEGAAQASSEDHDHLGARRPRPHRASGARHQRRGRAHPSQRRDRRGDADRSGARACLLRHLVGRSRQVRRRHARVHRARRRRCSTVTPIGSCSAPTRSRRRTRRRTSKSSTCTRRVWRALTPDASRKCARATTSACSTRDGGRVRAWEDSAT